MKTDFATPDLHSARIAFTKSFERIVARANVTSSRIEVATLDEIQKALEIARKSLPIADISVANAVYGRNPSAFRLIRNGSDLSNAAMLAYLPLNGEGAAALLDGHFDGLTPDPLWVARLGEPIEANYIWLVYSPKKMVLGLRLLQELAALTGDIPMFARAANNASDRILRNIGFTESHPLFPAAPEWLLMVLPVCDTTLSSANRTQDITIDVARTLDDMMQVFAVRSATYVSEQFATYDEEFDGNDFCGTHLIGKVNGDAAGCVRIRYFGNFAKLERMAVRAEYRKTRLMFQLAKASIEHCRRKGFTKLYAHARADLVPLWHRFGARLMLDREPFSFSDIEFRELEMDINPTSDAITFGTDPMVTLRPEGEWSRLGPIDRAQLRPRIDRRPLIEAQLKRMHAL
jgi:predicted GNAT family N-acyltransferase